MSALITGLSHEGRGIALINGKTTFLQGGLPGETVEFTYSKKHKQFDEGIVTTVLQPSTTRAAAICEHYGVCGGCRLQHMNLSSQIQHKQSVLLEQFLHIAGIQISPEQIVSPLLSPGAGYRSKARLAVKYVRAKEKVLVGFHELKGRYIADIQSCAVLDPSVGNKLLDLAKLIQNMEAYQTIPQIEVAVTDRETALIFRHLEALSEIDIQKLIEFASTHNFTIYLQPGGLDSVHKLYPADNFSRLSYSLPAQNLQMQFHPSDFTQINTTINPQMINRAIEWLDIQNTDSILDLFCGIGNFTLPLARYAKTVVGVEASSTAIARANENSELNNITNAKFYCADLYKEGIQQDWINSTFDKILLDPPRTGALEMVQNIGKFKASTIVYVSCNPATLARDAKEIVAQGYTLKQVCVMDMFPHTQHVESMALFLRG